MTVVTFEIAIASGEQACRDEKDRGIESEGGE